MRIRRIVVFSALACVVVLVVLYGAAQRAVGQTASMIVSVDVAPKSDVIIVLGASVLKTGVPSDILEDRLLTAVDLYRAGKAPKILVSGDHGNDEYDEVNVMRKYLLEGDIPADDIFLDHVGFDTYDTMIRARDVFGVQSAIVATQTFHLPRALYIGNALGMTVAGVSSDRRAYLKEDAFAARERLANVKAYLNILLGAAPQYSGASIDISGDGRVTWDTKD